MEVLVWNLSLNQKCAISGLRKSAGFVMLLFLRTQEKPQELPRQRKEWGYFEWKPLGFQFYFLLCC